MGCFFSENENGIRQNKHFVIWGVLEFIHLDSGGDVQVIFRDIYLFTFEVMEKERLMLRYLHSE